MTAARQLLGRTLGLLLITATSLDGQQVGKGRTVLATVVDASGKAMVDFGPDDFVVSDDGDAREVLDVHVADYPLALVIDDSTQNQALPAVKTAVVRFLNRVGERPIAVATLSSQTGLLASLDDNRQTVIEAIQRIAPSAGTADPLGTVARAASVLRETGSPFSAIVVVSGNLVDARQLVQSQLVPEITESGAVVHVVVTRRAASDPSASAEEPPDLLRVLADLTHGQYINIFSPASYPIALDRLADRLSTELMVDYLLPSDAATGDVRVGVRRPGARVVGLGVSK